MLPLLRQYCGSCHEGAKPQAGFSVASWERVREGGKRGPAVTPGNAKTSLLVRYLTGERTPRMPLGGALDPAVIEQLEAAINAMQPAEAKPRDPHLDWVARKPGAPPLPAVRNAAWVRNPIDAFILAKLEEKGLRPAPPASRRALIRRVYFDLIGLPPPPDKVREFLEAAHEEAAYQRILDELLADPRYGERWARHWLDLARFAESDGFAIDGERPTAWRYRDYVIRALNEDKPYDVFVMEQLAGDEVRDPRAGDRSARLVALGFLRMATWEADANFKTQLRQDFLNEITATTGSVFLGMTVGCARCHDHKYDPISTRDFYRLQAFFAATRIDERPAGFLPAENPKEMRRLHRYWEDEAEAAAEALAAREAELKKKYIAAKNLSADAKEAADFTKALRDKKDPVFSETDRQEYEAARNRSRQASEAVGRYRAVAYSVSDVMPPHVPGPPDTFILHGGELAAKGEKVEPGFPAFLNGGQERNATIPFAGGSSGRRLALAEWIASPENPLTARVIVNRLWQHHFGEGIVRTPSDFGRNGDRPSHPELLDWLAARLVEERWSLKAMHRLMLTSSAYRQSAEHPDAARQAEIDPENRLLSRMNWLRLESEVVRDAILSLSGRLQPSPGGPGVFFAVGQDVADAFEFFKWFPSGEREQLRRTVYMFQRRSVMMPMMEVFDGANMSESCARRSVTTVAPQAFTLWNGALTDTESKHFAARVRELAGPDPDRQLEHAFWLALSRPPSPAEARQARQLLGKTAAGDPLASFGAVLFNLNEFVYLE